MTFSAILVIAALAFVNCNDVSKVHLGPVHYEFKKISEVEVIQPQFPQEPSSGVQNRNAITDGIKEVIESFREDVDDPMVVDHLGPFEVTATGTRVAANLWNLHATGLSWYVVDKVTFNPLRLSMGVHMTLPWLTVTGAYDASARILLVGHNAGGNLRVFLHRVEVGVDLRLGTNILGGGHLTLRELDINIDIHDSNIQIEGLVGSSVLNSLINSFIQNMSQEFIQNEMGSISQMISDELFDVINEILKGYKLEDLLG